MVLERSRLDVSASPQDALRHLRGDRMPFALIGDWAGSRAVLGSEPFRGRLDSLTELDLELGVGVSRRGRPGPTTTAAAADAPSDAAGEAVGGGWFGWLGYGVGAMVDRFPVQPRRPEPLERLGMAFYDHVLRLDSDGVWWFEALVTEARRAALRGRRRLLEARLRGAPSRA
ncbi:MAG: hypothetical protein H0W09_02250, partial [Solirubrobacterales bacterium]|nr:hypothetical protein [Solirubrobacterales bacterium]